MDKNSKIAVDPTTLNAKLALLFPQNSLLTQEGEPANKQAVVTEAGAADVGGFGYFPEWDELSGSIINPDMDKIWSGESKPADELNALCTQVDQFLKDKGYPKQ